MAFMDFSGGAKDRGRVSRRCAAVACDGLTTQTGQGTDTQEGGRQITDNR